MCRRLSELMCFALSIEPRSQQARDRKKKKATAILLMAGLVFMLGRTVQAVTVPLVNGDLEGPDNTLDLANGNFTLDQLDPGMWGAGQFDLYNEALQAATHEERIDLMKQVIQNAADNFWVIGISSANDGYHPVSARTANVPDFWIWGWNPGGYAIALPEQWYFTE